MYSFNVKGFTLVELMVVIALLSLVLALAVSSYGKFLVKTKMIEVYSYVESAKSNVEQYFYAHGSFPSDATVATYDHSISNSDAIEAVSFVGCNESDAHQLQISIRESVTGVSGNAINMVVQNLGNGQLKWYCLQAGDPLLSPEYLPKGCVVASDVSSFCTTSGPPEIVE